MKALVTGASGFIGSTLIEDLNAQGFEVFALMRKTSDTSNLEGISFTRIEGDLANAASLEKAVEGMDYVFHLAGATAAPNPDAYFRHNAEGTRHLVEATARANPNVKRFVYVSSLAAAGPASSLERPRVESEENRPVSAYGQSKLQGEIEVQKLRERIPVAIVRPPMVYGPKDKGVFVVIQTVARRLMPVVQGDAPGGHKYYSAIHVRDLTNGIVQVGLSPNDRVSSGEVFYLSGDGVTSYENLLATIAQSLGVKPFRFPVPQGIISVAASGLTAMSKLTGRSYPLNQDKVNEIFADYWTCSNEKARAQLGFQPQFELSKGMDDAIAWYRSKNWL